MSTESSGEAKHSSSSNTKSSNQSNQPLPFEPRTKRKKGAKTQPAPVAQKATQKKNSKPVTKKSTAIPEAVSKRMVRRMALMSGIPTVLGIATFLASYLLVKQFELKFPNVIVVLVSMGFFGLGVLGLSYSVLSASWDEDAPGTKLGWQEFKTNWGRMTAAWRSAKQ